jgi:hypothetical protein
MTAQLFSTPSLRADGHTIWSIPLNRVHVTRSRANGARRSRYVHMHGATLKPGEVVTVDVLVTSPARTVVDLARTVPFEQAVVVADAALAIGLVDAEAVVAWAAGLLPGAHVGLLGVLSSSATWCSRARPVAATPRAARVRPAPL